MKAAAVQIGPVLYSRAGTVEKPCASWSVGTATAMRRGKVAWRKALAGRTLADVQAETDAHGPTVA
ncbi:hypothetical protein [Streptomyces sp. NBC_00316]|uniref:hypothetical protein n=1 Tax=Streptomyces sp. NBC_00316 TaxID=2975710 RepID=UPI002E2E70E4|nr:hypothetical protein [Streptomyces sp. NBC_00316]